MLIVFFAITNDSNRFPLSYTLSASSNFWISFGENSKGLTKPGNTYPSMTLLNSKGIA